MNELTIPARDGFLLEATYFAPQEPNGRSILINAATAVPQTFYTHFATFLAERGYVVYTFDYRGIGRSRPASLRGFQARMRDWGERDIAGVLDHIHKTEQPEQLFVFGHSVGGQVMGLLDNSHLVDRLVTLSAQSGHWRLQGGNEKQKTWFFVTIMFPILTRLIGYFPWSRLQNGEDLPKGVALEWAGWCRNRRYLLGDKTLTSLANFERFTAPILAYSFEDDAWGTARSVDAMMLGGYTAAPVERRHVAPADFGLQRIGHFGFFRRKSKPLWEDAITWLEEREFVKNE